MPLNTNIARHAFLAVLLGFGSLSLAACDDADTPAEEVGEAVEETGEAVEDAAEEATD